MNKIDYRIRQILIWMEHENLCARRELECGDDWLRDHTEALAHYDAELTELLNEQSRPVPPAPPDPPPIRVVKEGLF